MNDMDQVAERAQAIVDANQPLGEEEAREFLRENPLGSIFSSLRDAKAESPREETLCTALEMLFASNMGSVILDETIDSIPEALASPSRRIRLLATKQLRQASKVIPGRLDKGKVESLLATLRDPDTGVAATCSEALADIARQGPSTVEIFQSEECKKLLKDLLLSTDSTVQARATATAVTLASCSTRLATSVLNNGLNEG